MSKPRTKPPAPKKPRETIDYSAKGGAIAAEPPITVNEDELLQRLREGQR